MSGKNEPLKFSIERLLNDDGKDDRSSCSCQYCLLSLCYQFHNNYRIQNENYRIEKSVKNDVVCDTLECVNENVTDTFAVTGRKERKKAWSRAVFSSVQRMGLEKRFEIQKYITKPDRKQLAEMLGLSDNQVKIWFQNRRMKWRHSANLHS